MKFFKPLYCIVLLLSQFANGQNLEIGVRSGLNLSTLRTGDNSGTDFTGSTEALTRFSISLTSEYTFSDHFSLDGSFGYQGRGGKDFDEESVLRIGIDNFERKLEYLSLSFLFRYYPFNTDKLRPFLTIGPGFSYLVSAQELGNEIDEEDVKSKLDISSIAGIGVKFALENEWSIEVLGGIDRGWNKTLRQRNPVPTNVVFESLFNEVFWVSIGLKKTL
ncbi:porin family protein [Flagellimonas meridianipacifica]|uniref:Outer membrane protein with beta-barrel domain n=1 Tax=Flagellimonas meridianipacifica TaxID=1080225 RepID=A0A2T0MCX4_9FLAO|nr:porin family protein [Allomuricauda pacifica]PRX55352.1 outer membrane protein with beta-barrel domain [Allomuricauda pacifica]